MNLFQHAKEFQFFQPQIPVYLLLILRHSTLNGKKNDYYCYCNQEICHWQRCNEYTIRGIIIALLLTYHYCERAIYIRDLSETIKLMEFVRVCFFFIVENQSHFMRIKSQKIKINV